MAFRDRSDAGRILAGKLARYRARDDVVVLALPRGGVPVAFEVARSLCAPLDVFVVRKLGVPGREELAFGALASGGLMVLNPDIVAAFHLSDKVVKSIAVREYAEVVRRERDYRGERAAAAIRDRIAIIIDDGLATGASMRAAAEAIRQRRPKRVVIAVPVSALATRDLLREHVDEIVCVMTPEPFLAVGLWYENFTQVTDDDVKTLLIEAHRRFSQPTLLQERDRSITRSSTVQFKEQTMRCEVCGNEYDKAFSVISNEKAHVFDSFECAIHALAPECAHCGCKIIGHGMEQERTMYCCASCARQSGVAGVADRAETVGAQ